MKTINDESPETVKYNKGITLIALVITIIVLLILAAVSIAMLTGEDGILKKASNAKEKHVMAQYEEELRMCVIDLKTDVEANGEIFNMNTIKEKFAEKLSELENKDDIEFPTDTSTESKLYGTYKGYKFYIDDKYSVYIEESRISEPTFNACIYDANNQQWKGENCDKRYTKKGTFQIEDNIMSFSNVNSGSFSCVTINKIAVPKEYTKLKLSLKTTNRYCCIICRMV